MRLMRTMIVAVAVLAACGGRDQLYVGDPIARPGGSGGLGGAGGLGGMGGSVVPQGGCASLQLVDPIAVPLDGAGAVAVRSAQLTFADTSGNTAVLVASYQPTAGLAELRHTAFEPWDAWPQDGLLEAGHLIDATGITNFTAARGIEGRFAVSFIQPEPNPIGLVTGIDYLAYEPQPSALGGTVAPNATRLLDSGHGVRAFTQPAGAGDQQQLYMLLPFQVDNGFQWSGPYLVGCTEGAPMAAVAGTFDGGLIAAHQGSDIGVSCAATTPEPPERIYTGRALYGSNAGLTFGTLLETGPLVALRMTSDNAGGAWLLWQTTEELATLKAVRLGDSAQQLSNILQLQGAAGGRWGVHFNAGVLWLAEVGGGSGELAVRRYDSFDGKLLSEGSASIGSGQGPLEVLVAPDGEQAVVAFAEQTAEGERVRVAKFACSSR